MLDAGGSHRAQTKNPAMTKSMRPKHPSGRPIRQQEARKLSITRNPGTGSILERLRPPTGRLEAVGFHHPAKWKNREGEEDDKK
jgi:hypothetical protein